MITKVHIHESHSPSVPSQVFSSGYHENSINNSKNKVHRISQLYNFSLVICRHPHTGKFLLCQEFANQGYWCPGGAVDPGETLTTAAVRETIEEAGIEVELKGILGVEYNPVGISQRTQNHIIRLRVIFYAEPTQSKGMSQLPKSSPDYESAGACWCSYEEIQSDIKLRGNEPKRWSK
jgi:8-oxo-dGTP pyrophosphatase MutT (NUDIX family)